MYVVLTDILISAKQAENDEEREAGLQELADQLLQEDKEFIKKINRSKIIFRQKFLLNRQ